MVVAEGSLVCCGPLRNLDQAQYLSVAICYSLHFSVCTVMSVFSRPILEKPKHSRDSEFHHLPGSYDRLMIPMIRGLIPPNRSGDILFGFSG